MKQNGKDLLRNPPQKVILMYEAVNDMINEGCDINTIKVLDITSRAGIGKGTAYEYFTTKEEIIMRALVYQMMSYLKSISDITYSDTSFQEKLDQLMNFGMEHFDEGRTFYQILKVILGVFDISDAMKQEFQQMQEENICNQFWVLVDDIIKAGVEEGILQPKDVLHQHLIINSQMVAFTMCLFEYGKREQPKETFEDIKRYVYENLVKLFQ